MVSEAKFEQLKRQMIVALKLSPLSESELSKKLDTNLVVVKRLLSALRDEGFYIIEKDGRYFFYMDRIFFHDVGDRIRTSVIGRKILFYKEVDSTMDIAREKSFHEGLVVLAEKQRKGRGRRNRPWFSPGGGLWFSIVLKPRMPPNYVPLVNLMSSLAVAKAIRDLVSLRASLRWPNDVIINGRKVCGVISEAEYSRGEISSVIVGVGVNVNIEKESLPEELREIATSLYVEAGYPIPPLPLLCKILENMDKSYASLLKGKYQNIVNNWKYYSSTIGSQVEVVLDSEVIKGKALDLDDYGRLVLLTEGGDVKVISSGELKRLRARSSLE